MKKTIFILSFILLLFLQVSAQAPELKSKEITLLLRYQSYPAYTRIVIEGEEEILKEAKVLRNGDSKFSIEFKKKTFLIKPSALSVKDGLVSDIEVVEKGDKKILNILLEKAPYEYKSFFLKDPPRRVLDIYRVPAVSSSSIAKATVVIDPGHGGASIGAVGTSGLQEKVLTLDIALRLKAQLQKNPDIKVILTRSSDLSVPLRERAFIGNTNKADLFISLHGNSSFGKTRREFAIYILPPAETKTKEDTNPYLWDIQHEKAVKESNRLAEALKESLKQIRGEDIKIKEAPILELMGVDAPSVLLEIPMGPEEEKSLQKESYKNKIASDLSEGMIGYLKKRSESIRPVGIDSYREGETLW
jgi:N-acetylmuramoyl-L-alanine amidase